MTLSPQFYHCISPRVQKEGKFYSFLFLLYKFQLNTRSFNYISSIDGGRLQQDEAPITEGGEGNVSGNEDSGTSEGEASGAPAPGSEENTGGSGETNSEGGETVEESTDGGSVEETTLAQESDADEPVAEGASSTVELTDGTQGENPVNVEEIDEEDLRYPPVS